MKIQKKHIVMTALVLALATAVYINYQISQAKSTSPVKELGAASYVNATVGQTATSDEAVATMALSKEQQDFFAAERTKRQNTQDKVIDDAEEILESDSSADSELTEAQENVERIIGFFTTQDTIETIVKAKGFSDCLCCITDMGVTVIVPENELNENTVLSVYDAVTTHYDIASDAISVVGA